MCSGSGVDNDNARNFFKGTLINDEEILIKWEHEEYGEGEFKMTKETE